MSNGYCPICKLCTRATSGWFAAGGAMCGCDPKDRQAARDIEKLEDFETRIRRITHEYEKRVHAARMQMDHQLRNLNKLMGVNDD